MSERNQSLLLFLLFVVAVLFRLFLFLTIGYTTDDALITYRYAENIAAGRGFVYNEGVRVLGTTTPFMTLLLALGVKLGIPVFSASFALAALADVMAARAVYSLFENVAVFPWLAAIIYLFNPETLQWSLSGMETSLSTAWILISFALAAKQRWISSFVFAALAVLTRIDGLAVPTSLGLAFLMIRKRFPWKETAVTGLILLPWFLFSWFYFHTLIPNSAAAKWALSGSSRLMASTEILLCNFLHLHTIGIPLLIPAVIGTIVIISTKRQLLPLVFWTWGYALAYSLAAGPMHPWYYPPFYAGYLILILTGVIFLLQGYGLPPLLVAIMTLSALSVMLFFTYYRINTMNMLQGQMKQVNRATGEWIHQNTPEDAVVAIKDIGYIGYYSGRRILDLAGLVSPECIPYRVRGDFLGPILRFQPDYFAFSEGQSRQLGLDQSGVLKSYRLVKEIRSLYGTYRIYSRN